MYTYTMVNLSTDKREFPDVPEEKEHLHAQVDERGFSRLPRIPSQYGGYTEIYESSAATSPHLWVRTVSPANLSEPDGDQVEGINHMTVEDAVRLAEQLLWMVSTHYQGEEA